MRKITSEMELICITPLHHNDEIKKLRDEVNLIGEEGLALELLGVKTKMLLEICKETPKGFEKFIKSKRQYGLFNKKAHLKIVIQLHFDQRIRPENKQSDESSHNEALLSIRPNEYGIEITDKEYRLIQEFKIAFDNFYLALIISNPLYWSSFLDLYCCINGNYFLEQSTLSSSFLESILEEIEKNKWPILKQIPLKNAWEWFLKYKDAFEGYSSSQMGRVINALKYSLIVKNDDDYGTARGLVWMAVALEALYNDPSLKDEISISKQITRKAFTLLGKPQEGTMSDRTLQKLYKFRSDFFHGAKDFPAPNFPWETEKFVDEFMLGWYDISVKICTIVFATMQILIEKNLEKLDFELTFKLVEKND